MDIVLIHPSFNVKGGAERIILEIVKKYNPIIYTLDYDKDKIYKEFQEFDIRQLPKPIYTRPMKLFGPRMYHVSTWGVAMWNLKIKEDYDVINTQGTPSELTRNKNPRVMWYCHSPNREAFDLRSYRQACRNLPTKLVMGLAIESFKKLEYSVVPKIEKIVTNSNTVKNRISKYLKRDDAEVIYPFAEENKFKEGQYNKYFLYPSRLVPEKRQDLIINAFKEFSKTRKDFKLIITGFLADRNKKYFEELKEMAKGYNIKFILSPDDQHLVDLYSNSYTVLFAAMNEDLGLIPFEAGLSKKPIISVNEGGPTETILNNRSGFLVDATPTAFAEKMIYLAGRPEIVEQMGKEGYKNISTNYSKKSFFKKYDKALKFTAKL